MFAGSQNNVKLIKATKKVADAVIKKIIYYISLFSEEVRSQLQDECLSEDSIKLENITTGFIEVILEILEKYELIKLCLILCNRFKLTSKLGRYVVSSCLKYQSLQQLRFTPYLDTFKVENVKVKQLRQQGLIAHEALHNVFSLVDPTYLSLKKYGEELTMSNSLGMDNFRLMFALGFWKKLVYTMSVSQSLELCYKFNDVYNFN